MSDPMTDLGRRLAAARAEFAATPHAADRYRFPPIAPPPAPKDDLAALRRALVKVALFMAGWFVGVMSCVAVVEGWL